MSHLHPGEDDDLHYSDNSHRWIAPSEIGQAAWSAHVRSHMQEHLATMGGVGDVDQVSHQAVAASEWPVHHKRKGTTVMGRKGDR